MNLNQSTEAEVTTKVQNGEEIEVEHTDEVVCIEGSPFDQQKCPVSRSTKTIDADTESESEESSTPCIADANATQIGFQDSTQIWSVSYVDVSLIKPHPRNAEIYGDESIDPELLESIRANGILVPLIITETYGLISGHLRLKVAEKLGLKQVPVIGVGSLSLTEQLASLLDYNLQRKKSMVVIGMEAIIRSEIESDKAQSRQQAAGKRGKDETPDSMLNAHHGKKGKARDHVGSQLGLSGVTVDRLVQCTKALKKLESLRDSDKAKTLSDAINKSVSQGYRTAVALGVIERTSTKRSVKAATESDKNAPARKSEKEAAGPSELNSSAAQSPYLSDNPFPTIETLKDAMKVMDNLVEYLEDLAEHGDTSECRAEWVQSLERLQSALTAAKSIDT